MQNAAFIVVNKLFTKIKYLIIAEESKGVEVNNWK